jgi:acyl dehydratase
MALDKSFVGRTYPATPPYEVGREKIREFADAVGATDPGHRDPEAARAQGHPDVFAPPTFPVLITLTAGARIMQDPELGADYSRVVHGDQKFQYSRPVYAGDRLQCVCVIEEITSRAGNDFLTTRHEVSTEAGEPVVTVWSKLVVRGED